MAYRTRRRRVADNLTPSSPCHPTSVRPAVPVVLDFTVVHPVGRRSTELPRQGDWFMPVAATSGALHPATLRLLYDSARLKTDATEQHLVANSLRSPLTPEQLCQRRGATFARLRVEAQLYSLRASATRLTGKHWAAPYASSLLPRSRARARCGVGAFAPAPTGHVLASR